MTAPRESRSTLQLVEEHCAHFRHLFAEVRTFEHFQELHIGLLSQLPRKSLPAIARLLNMPNAQGLHNLLVTQHLSTADLGATRQQLVRHILGERTVTLMVDETGDPKKGTTTDYVSRQYLGRLGKIDNGLVTVHLVALVEGLTLPLTWRVFKPKGRLRQGDTHLSKIALACQMLEEVAQWGLQVELVVADSLYGMASEFVRTLQRLRWDYVLALRSDFGMYLPEGQEVMKKSWVQVERHFNDGTTEERWAQELVWGTERTERYVVLTTHPQTQPESSTSFVRVGLSGDDWLERLSDAYGRRTWVEATFRNQKTELGWHDWRLTRWEHIERWYELVLSVYTMVSARAFERLDSVKAREPASNTPCAEPTQGSAATPSIPGWRGSRGWVNTLRDIQNWVQPLAAIAVLMKWSAVLSLEHAPLHDALTQLCSMTFPQ